MRREQNLALVGAVVSGAVIATGLLLLLVARVNPDAGARMRGAMLDVVTPVWRVVGLPFNGAARAFHAFFEAFARCGFAHFIGEPFHHVVRRTFGRYKTKPSVHGKIRETFFGCGRRVGQRRHALIARYRQDTNLASLREREHARWCGDDDIYATAC